MTPDDGVWVYAVTGDGPFPGGISGIRGVAGEELRTVTDSGFTAVVGTVRLDTFGEEALRRTSRISTGWPTRPVDTTRSSPPSARAVPPCHSAWRPCTSTTIGSERCCATMPSNSARHCSRSPIGPSGACAPTSSDRAANPETRARRPGAPPALRISCSGAHRWPPESKPSPRRGRRADEIFAELARWAVAGVGNRPLPGPRGPSFPGDPQHVVPGRQRPPREFVTAVEELDARLSDGTWCSPARGRRTRSPPSKRVRGEPTPDRRIALVDLLDRVLGGGVVVAGRDHPVDRRRRHGAHLPAHARVVGQCADPATDEKPENAG